MAADMAVVSAVANPLAAVVLMEGMDTTVGVVTKVGAVPAVPTTAVADITADATTMRHAITAEASVWVFMLAPATDTPHRFAVLRVSTITAAIGIIIVVAPRRCHTATKRLITGGTGSGKFEKVDAEIIPLSLGARLHNGFACGVSPRMPSDLAAQFSSRRRPVILGLCKSGNTESSPATWTPPNSSLS